MGEDRESKHKHHKKHSSSSSSKKKKHKHKSEHKHKSSSSKKHRHHHKHGKSHKKHNKHKEKKRSDEVNLQTALENLEMLEDILKTSAEYSPDELMAQVLSEAQAEGGLGEEDSDDSSSDSDASLDLGPGDKPGSPVTGKAKDTSAVVGNTDELPSDGSSGKGSSSIPASEEAKTKPQDSKKAPEPTAPVTEQNDAEKETVSPMAKKEGENDDRNEVKGGKKLIISTDTTSPSHEKTIKGKNKLPSSQDEHSKSDVESTSDSEAESKDKTTGGTRNGTGVFKPFSKKVKALGSKTEIKINIRQKEGDKTAQSKEGRIDDSKKNDSHRSSADSAKKESRRESESRRHKRSSRRSRTRSRSRSRSRSRTRYRRRHSRSHSRSPRRCRSRSRSRSYSRRSRRGRSHSRSRRRSRSRSYSRSRRRSRRSRSRSWRRSRSRSRSYSSTPPPSKRKKNSVKSKSEVKETPVETKVDKKTEISQLTAFCKDLQAKQAHEDVHGETPQATAQPAQIHHPFAVNPNQPTSTFHQPSLIFHNNVWKTTSQLAIEAAVTDMAKPLVEKFPVSAGLQHTREEETASGSSNVFAQYQELSKMSVSDLVAKRTEIQKQILINPADVEAHKALNYIQQQTSMWAESKVTPGQYTGQQKITPLSKEAHNTGYQAWAKKRMFYGLAPVGDGFGMKMLKKMGWKEGQPIGKQGEGHVEPICLDVKMDRFGLTTESDYSKGSGVQPATVLRGTKADVKTASLVQGKHPVSALQELCARKRWDPPCYTIKEDAGPAHLKMFLYQVTIPLGTFQPAVGSNSKKLAKMQAATAALQGIGLLEKTIEYITL